MPCQKKAIKCIRHAGENGSMVKDLDPIQSVLTDLDIFALGLSVSGYFVFLLLTLIEAKCSYIEFRAALNDPHVLIERNASHRYESILDWDTQALIDACIGNLQGHDYRLPLSWLFGSSSSFSNSIPSLLREMIQALLESSYHLYCIPDSWLRDQHCAIRGFCGSHVLQQLTISLRPSNLAKSSFKTLMSLFFLLFASLLAVSYFGADEDADAVSKPLQTGSRC